MARLFPLVVLALATPLALALGPGGAPEPVVAIPAGAADMLVAWTPSQESGQENASYWVYGERLGGLEFLVETFSENALVAAGYASYVVATVVEGEVVEMRSSAGYCVTIIHGIPPQVGVHECGNRLVKYHDP